MGGFNWDLGYFRGDMLIGCFLWCFGHCRDFLGVGSFYCSTFDWCLGYCGFWCFCLLNICLSCMGH